MGNIKGANEIMNPGTNNSKLICDESATHIAIINVILNLLIRIPPLTLYYRVTGC